MRKGALLLSIVAAAVAGVAALGWITIHHGFSARDNPSLIETFVARTARGLAVPAGAKRMRILLPNTPDNLARARAHFADHCAICHANNGNGNTDLGRNLYPKAPDMRLPQTQNLSDGELYYTIHNGIRLTGMPAWGSAEKDEGSWEVVLFIRHLPQLTPAEEREMEALNPKGPGEKQEEQDEERFLNEGQPANQAPKPQTQHHH